MTMIASCGHKVQSPHYPFNRAIADYDELGNRAVYYMSLCPECFTKYQKDGIILHDEGEENKWLGGK